MFLSRMLSPLLQRKPPVPPCREAREALGKQEETVQYVNEAIRRSMMNR